MKKIVFLLLFFLIPSSVYATSYVDDANCQGAYLMDANENPLSDSSQNSNTAAISDGNPTFATASPPAGGFSSGYYVYDGNDAHKITDHATLDITQSLTLVGWVSLDSLTVASVFLFNKWLTTTNNRSYRVYSTTSAGLIFSLSSDGTNVAGKLTNLTASSAFTQTNTWYHVAATFNYVDGVDDTMTLYLNGESVAAVSTHDSGIFSSSADVYLGHDDGVEFHAGDLDECAIFNRALSPTEINDIMDNGLVGSGTPAVVSLPMNAFGTGMGRGFMRGGR